MSKRQVIALDWDNTLWLTKENEPHPRAWEILDIIRERGYKSMIFSCNNPAWLRKMCEEHNLQPDYIWGEHAGDVGKPVFACLIDDRALRFKGDWLDTIAEALQMVKDRPVGGFRGVQYQGNPKRDAELHANEHADGNIGENHQD